jgi:hypothetical protein
MKKLIPILFLIILITSCEEKSCYECTTFEMILYFNDSYRNSYYSDSEIICDITFEEAMNYQDLHSFTDTVKVGFEYDYYIYEESCYCLPF